MKRPTPNIILISKMAALKTHPLRPNMPIAMDSLDYGTISSIEAVLPKMRSKRKIVERTKAMVSARNRVRMRWLWRSALNHMPYNSILADKDMPLMYRDQVEALAACLDIKPARIWRNLIHGSAPRKQLSREILEKLASEAYGEQMAAIRLSAKGLLTQYPYWPSQPVKKRTRGHR